MSRRDLTIAELATLTESTIVGDPHKRISNIADLESAGSDDASFLANPNYERAMRASKAGVVFISPAVTPSDGRNYLINENPSRAFQKTVETFLGDELTLTTGFDGIHPTAVIHPTAKLGEGTHVAPHAVIDANAMVGADCSIGAGVYIGRNVTIGDRTTIHPNVTVRERCQIGSNVTLQPGAVIGSCGFGYTTDAKGIHTKLNQVGIVIIEDDVEIGANTTIDRSRFKATVIGRGTKIDNLVQIGHGVTVGRHSIIISQTGVAGSTHIGNHVVIAGQCAIAGHLSIADGAIISARTGVSKTIPEAGKYGGVPAVSMDQYNRTSVYLRNIATYVEQIRSLQARVSNLENNK